MPLVLLQNVHLAYGGPALLNGVSLTIEPGDRIGLLGRNGAGKSTLMRVVTGEARPDEGEVILQKGMTVAELAQEVPEGAEGTVFEVVSGGLGEVGDLVREYHRLAHALEAGDGDLERLSEVQHGLEAAGGWTLEQRIEAVVTRLRLDADLPFAALSGGVKRRVMLARALVREPDLLLLDEPTNHLDLDTILWLEEFLLSYQGALLFVTHDRAFLRRLANRILELDRGNLTDWPGDYDNFLRRKEEMLNAEEKANERFDKRLAQEEVWIRQGIKARRTRNMGRVRQLVEMRRERTRRREQQGRAGFAIEEAERSGKLVVEVEGVSQAWDGRTVIRDLDITIMRGDRIGIIGPNGAGKSTLLKILLGDLTPDQGRVRFGTRLEIAYFDQLRDSLDPTATVVDAVAEGRDRIAVAGQNKHVIGYLQEFLFTPDRARQPVASLSGGERGRLLLARLFTKPFNLLVMDEPTNDLDAETLELLEERLLEYQGTLLLVSHDRAFLDNVVTSTLVFEGDGRVGEYVGGYEDWVRQRRSASPPPSKPKPDSKSEDPKSDPMPVASKPAGRTKLSYKDQRELEALPDRIAALEAEAAAVQARLGDPATYRDAPAEVPGLNARLATLEVEIQAAYARWEALESG